MAAGERVAVAVEPPVRLAKWAAVEPLVLLWLAVGSSGTSARLWWDLHSVAACNCGQQVAAGPPLVSCAVAVTARRRVAVGPLLGCGQAVAPNGARLPLCFWARGRVAMVAERQSSKSTHCLHMHSGWPGGEGRCVLLARLIVSHLSHLKMGASMGLFSW